MTVEKDIGKNIIKIYNFFLGGKIMVVIIKT